MAIKITKQLAVVEDLVFGIGTITQQRDVNGNGPEDVIYNKINASFVPTVAGGTVEEELALRPTTSELDLDQYAKVVDVLTKTQLTPYTPTNTYHPATKDYVDQTVVDIGTGDMAKAVYDIAGNGVVDNSEALGGLSSDLFDVSRGAVTDLDAAMLFGTYQGFDVSDAPATGAIILKHIVTTGYIAQEITTLGSDIKWDRVFTTLWSPWKRLVSNGDVVNNLLAEPTDSTSVLGAYQGRVLNETKLAADDYGTATVGGTAKFRLDGTTLYITTDGTDA